MYVISSNQLAKFENICDHSMFISLCQANLQIWKDFALPDILPNIYYPIYSLITALLPDAMRDYSTKKLPSPSAHRPWLSLMCSSNLYQSPPSKRRPPAPNIEYAGRSSPLWPSSATSLAASTARKYSQWLQYPSIKCDLITTASPLYPGRVFQFSLPLSS